MSESDACSSNFLLLHVQFLQNCAYCQGLGFLVDDPLKKGFEGGCLNCQDIELPRSCVIVHRATH